MSEEQLQEKLNVSAANSKLLYIQINRVITISKCLVDYAVFRTWLARLMFSSPRNCITDRSVYLAPSSEFGGHHRRDE